MGEEVFIVGNIIDIIVVEVVVVCWVGIIQFFFVIMLEKCICNDKGKWMNIIFRISIGFIQCQFVLIGIGIWYYSWCKFVFKENIFSSRVSVDQSVYQFVREYFVICIVDGNGKCCILLWLCIQVLNVSNEFEWCYLRSRCCKVRCYGVEVIYMYVVGWVWVGVVNEYVVEILVVFLVISLLLLNEYVGFIGSSC